MTENTQIPAGKNTTTQEDRGQLKWEEQRCGETESTTMPWHTHPGSALSSSDSASVTSRAVGYYFVTYIGGMDEWNGTGVGYWRGSDWCFFMAGSNGFEEVGHANDSELSWVSQQIPIFEPPPTFYRWVKPPSGDWCIGATNDGGATYNVPDLSGNSPGGSYSKQDVEIGSWVPVQTGS